MRKQTITQLVGASAVVLMISATAHAAQSTDKRIEILEDRDDLRQIASCYGIAQDVVNLTNHREGAAIAKTKGLEEFDKCFVPNAKFTTLFFGNTEQPFSVVNSTSEWIDGIIEFAQQNNFTSTRHLIGNIEITMTGRNTATVTASSLTPHYQGRALETPEPSNILVAGAYTGKARKIHGEWKFVEFVVDLEDAQSVSGVYPFGAHPGTN